MRIRSLTHQQGNDYAKVGGHKTEGFDLTVRFHLSNALCESAKTVVDFL